MTKYTFEIQWPAPFEGGWKRSGQKWLTSIQAAKELGEYLAISADNGILMEGRLVILSNSDLLE